MRTAPLLLPLVLLAGCAAQAADTRVDPKALRGAIGGRIQFPAGVAPAMRICAVAAAARQCIDSPAGRTLYRIEHLPDGEYQVVAKVESVETPVAGYVQDVQCIRAPCPPQLVSVAIADGKEVADADLNGFYAAREDFPTTE